MNRRYEGEEYNINEIQQIKEYITFDAEDFKSVELIKLDMEQLDVSEIKPTSFPVEENSLDNKINNNAAKKDDNLLKRILKSTTTSGTMSTSLGSAGVLLVAGVAGAGMVLTPILNNNSCEVLNCYIEYEFNEQTNDTTSDIIITFNEKLQDEFICEIINLNNDEIIELDTNLDYVIFEDLKLDKYDFKINLKNAIGEIIEEKQLNVDTNFVSPYLNDAPYDYLLSYNKNKTSNLYFSPLISKENIQYEIETKLFINNEGYDFKTYTSNYINNVSYIDNIKEEDYIFTAKTYARVDNNYYLIAKSPEIYANTNNFSNNIINAHGKKIDITFIDEIYSDVNIKVIYKNDNTSTDYIIKKEDIVKDIPISLELEKISESIDIIVNCDIINNNYNQNNLIKNHKGTLNKFINETITLNLNTQSYVEINRVEFLDNSYNYDANDNVNRFYFDGYLLDNSYLNVLIYNQNNQLIQTKENITDITKYVEFLDLDNQYTYKIEYQVFDEVGSGEKKSYYFDINKPSSMDNASAYNSHPNPSDVYLTYNEDKTYNAHFYTDFKNEGDYQDVYYKIALNSYLEDGQVVCYEKLSNEKVCVIEGISPLYSYEISYYLFAKDGMNYYSISTRMVPSGTLGLYYEGDYVYLNYASLESLENNQYRYSAEGMIHGDVNVEVIYDDLESENIIIPFETIEVIDVETEKCSFIIDLSMLSSKEKTIKEIVVTGNMEIYHYYKEIIKANIDEIKGSEVTKFIFIFELDGG